MSKFPEAWLKSELLKILGFEPDEIIQYLKSIDDSEEQRLYLIDMLDANDPNHLNFIKDFTAKVKSSAKISALAPPGMVAYKKSDDVSYGGPPGFGTNGARPKSNQKLRNTPETNKENVAKSDSSAKKGGKFVPLYAKDGNVDEQNMILPGRNKCKCQAQKHELINNCIKCGRVVCKQEGSGPCLFCGNLVCTKEEQEVLNRGSRKSDKLREKLLSTEAQSKAELHKNNLLEYDKTSEKRTQVIDDESDYFATDTDKWMTKDQRKKMKEREKEIWEQKHGSRLNKKYTIDFGAKTIVEDGVVNYDASKDEKLKSILETHKISTQHTRGKDGEFKGSDVANPRVLRPTFVALSDQKSNLVSVRTNDPDPMIEKHIMRIQDAQLQVMSDDGWCLSMHQPWASYLITGIKMHEGRTWYSPHRGRLWIHAASKVPSEEEIKAVQASYRGAPREFPKNLPVSCLLGCVDVDDVLAQEEYRERFPRGESAAPFVFICTNPQELMIKFPMSGKHKIYKMDPNIHGAANVRERRCWIPSQ